MELTTADRIWNRAALEAGGITPRPGDRALASLLLVHGFIMNGGVQHAIEAVASDDLSAALDGYEFFGFHDVAAFLRSVAVNPIFAGTGGNDDVAYDQQYWEMVPDDSTLVGRFEQALRERPEHFAELRHV